MPTWDQWLTGPPPPADTADAPPASAAPQPEAPEHSDPDDEPAAPQPEVFVVRAPEHSDTDDEPYDYMQGFVQAMEVRWPLVASRLARFAYHWWACVVFFFRRACFV